MTSSSPLSPLRDLANPAGVLTLARLPMAVALPFLAERPRLLLAIYLLGVGTDVVDGWLARRTNTTSQVGAYADGLADKAFHLVMAGTLWWGDHVPAWWLPLWFAREAVQGSLIAAFLATGVERPSFTREANRLGKATTLLLGVTVVSVLLGLQPAAGWLTLLVGALGIASGVSYGLREIQSPGGSPG